MDNPEAYYPPEAMKVAYENGRLKGVEETEGRLLELEGEHRHLIQVNAEYLKEKEELRDMLSYHKAEEEHAKDLLKESGEIFMKIREAVNTSRMNHGDWSKIDKIFVKYEEFIKNSL